MDPNIKIINDWIAEKKDKSLIKYKECLKTQELEKYYEEEKLVKCLEAISNILQKK